MSICLLLIYLFTNDRKIPDNYCFGGVNHSPISISCSYVPVSYQSVFILLIVMIIIFILANSNFPNLVKQHIS